TDARRLTADQVRNLRENLAQRHVLSSEDVTLPDSTAMKREKMARGNVIDVDDVEARVDIRGGAAGSGIEDDPARRRGFHIARPDRCRGVDDHHRGTRLRDLAGKLLREKLRALVVAD